MAMNVTIDVTQCIAEIVATSFDAGRPVLHRYSATVVLHAPDKTATQKCIGYGEDETEARHNAIGGALRAWGWDDLDRMDFVEEVPIAAGNLPSNYGTAYLHEAYICAECANRLPAESQARRDIWAVSAAYERQYLESRYDYLRSRK
jgi:hypothetical protein